jgi:hypothetical protein
MSKADANMERDSRNASERSPATSSEALEAPDTQRVIEAFKDMPGRELVEMIGHARRLEKRLRRVAHNIVGPYVGIEEHSERVANALTELDRLQQSAQSENMCTACGAKEGEPCRGNCERAMPPAIGDTPYVKRYGENDPQSSIGDTTASSTMYVNGHFDIREALDKPTRKADLDLARYILKNLCGWNCRDVVSDEERDTEYLADMISAARYGHATQSATGYSELSSLADQLEMAYGDMPKDRPPGPPTTIVQKLRELASARPATVDTTGLLRRAAQVIRDGEGDPEFTPHSVSELLSQIDSVLAASDGGGDK